MRNNKKIAGPESSMDSNEQRKFSVGGKKGCTEEKALSQLHIMMALTTELTTTTQKWYLETLTEIGT